MFGRFILPTVLMAMVGAPMLYSNSQRNHLNVQDATSLDASAVGFNSLQSTSFAANPNWQRWPGTQSSLAGNPTATPTNSQVPASFVTTSITDEGRWQQTGLQPDFAKAQTFVFPGNASGPDLTAQPMTFTPTVNLSTLFRFDISEPWVTSRWDRISTVPVDQGLHGMRVALVTGTNSWDLHGSLTYFFDADHRLQRITYRGWTGDASRLLQFLRQQYGLQPQPTHWAGVYLSRQSGLLMKRPSVIDKSNPIQQLALILELNNPQENVPLSDDFRSLLPAALSTQ